MDESYRNHDYIDKLFHAKSVLYTSKVNYRYNNYHHKSLEGKIKCKIWISGFSGIFSEKNGE